MSQSSREMRILYIPAPSHLLLDNETPSIVQAQSFKHDMEKHWIVPQIGKVLLEGHQIFLTYDEAKEYQNAVIESMITKLRTRKSKLNDDIHDVEVL